MKNHLKLIGLIILAVVVAAGAQTQVNVKRVDAPANSNKAAAQSDTIMCATDKGCIIGDGSGHFLPTGDAYARAIFVMNTPSTTSGTAPCPLQSTASTNSTNCKNTTGQIYHISGINTTSTNYFLRLYNLGSAPTCSSATGFVRTIPVPGASSNGGGIEEEIGAGEAYANGIGFCLTGGGSSTDNTNAATGVYININYK